MTDSSFLERARVFLAELQRADAKHTVFGASSHRYRLQPALDSSKLEERERQLGITLPADFRAFLTELGNGGAGPSYGVFSFEGGDSEDYTKYEQLSQPFAYTEAYNPTGLIGSTGDKDDEEEEENDDEDPKQSYWEAFDDGGALYICHHGCGARSLLIVSGPARGQVWDDGVADEHGYKPDRGANGAVHTFASWYLEWLESSLSKLASASKSD